MDGRLIYLNPAAEVAFGVDFADIGELSLEQALAIAQPTDLEGAPMTPDTVPIGKTLDDCQPGLGTVLVCDPQGRLHRLGTTTVPVQGQGGTLFGALSVFWELEVSPEC
jgi:hypothetical protein